MRTPPYAAMSLYCVAVASLVFLQTAAANDSPAAEGLQIVALQVEPSEIRLTEVNRSQQLLVTAIDHEGRPIDVTHLAEVTSSDRSIAKTDASLISAVENGKAQVTVSHQGQQVQLPVVVDRSESRATIDFANHVVPLLSKFGCNSGACHGKASHASGLKLSVFGFDPAADYEVLVKADRGRRVFLASPERSLFLQKATGTIPHGGGRRLAVESADYDLILSWLRQGMSPAQANAPQLIALDVSPKERLLRANSQQQILATARYSDGSARDVTSAASYTSNAPTIAEVDHSGVVRMGNLPGEAAIAVHYMGQVAGVQFQSPKATSKGPSEFPPNNAVDELVAAKFAKMGLVPSQLCDDATFLRRLFLDTLGITPTPDEVRQFLSDRSSDKRARWIDLVLDRPEYADRWALFWADILLVDRQKLGDRGAFEFHRWLREQFASNRPYDQWAVELVTATGNSATSGPVNFFRAADTPEDLAKTVSQAFLGVRLECAQCHHHPFEKWSQDHFYGFAGFFSGLERRAVGPQRAFLFHAGPKESRIPGSNKLVSVRPLDGDPVSPSTGDPRRALAAWMVEPNNPYFSTLAANRLWKHFLGRGLVESEDDLRSTNPPTNGPLLTLLSRHLVESKFDLKALMRLIIQSRTYQLAGAVTGQNDDDNQNYTHHYVRRLSAEVLLDAISDATGSPEEFPGLPHGTRAMELWDNRMPSYFLEIFGRPERTTPCECGRVTEPTISQALHLMNAPEIEAKIAASHGRVANLLSRETDNARVVEELCLAALGRLPNESEISIAKKLFADSERQQAAEDFLWTLLNSYDFLFVK
jgi:hypothetical protein